MKIKFSKDKLYILAAVFVTVVISVWILEKPSMEKSAPDNALEEFATVIPKGFLVVPLILENGVALSPLIQKFATLDVFSRASKRLIAKNLKVLKLSAPGDEASYGALVPEKQSEPLQELLSQSALRGALKNEKEAPVEFYQHKKAKNGLDVIETTEEGQ